MTDELEPQVEEQEPEEETGPVPQAFIKVMLTPTSCGVMKFDDGRRMVVMTQGPFEISIPFGQGEAEQLSQELHVSPIDTATVAKARASGLALPR
jgi:hypothetical protein